VTRVGLVHLTSQEASIRMVTGVAQAESQASLFWQKLGLRKLLTCA
jgi:hypothetical protein